MTPPVSTAPPPTRLSPVQRLAASRQRLHLALYPPGLAERVEAAWRPSVQRHPWAWALGAVLAGGAAALLWRRLPAPWLAALKTALQSAGQEALWSWWLGTLAAQAPEARAPAATPAPGPGHTSSDLGT